jgi:O-antigen ligase
LGSALVSLLAGNALWDPAVPRPGNLLVVQLGQWAIFALSAGAFLLAAHLLANEPWLRRLTFAFLLLAGVLTAALLVGGPGAVVNRIATVAVTRAPFWISLVALAGGQLLFNRSLSDVVRFLLTGLVLGASYYALMVARESVSTWSPLIVALATLLWLRFPRLRRPLEVGGLIVIIVFFSTFYEFAGGDPEWILSGQSRLVLIERVVNLTSDNPILGLGPASYRHYARLEPLQYRGALWWTPDVSTHNNYVDIFAQTGLLGLGLFLWFMVALTRLCWRLRRRYREGFTAGYVNAMFAALVAISAAMMLLDWFLPFVYNVGFPGFQASVLLWMFLGGLVAINHWEDKEER